MKESTLITRFNKIEQELKQNFAILIELAQEVQAMGGQLHTVSKVLVELEDYKNALDKAKKKDAEAAAEASTEEEVTNPVDTSNLIVTNVEEPAETIKATIDYGDE